MIIVAYAIPGFLFALLLIIVFAGGSYWQWFPMQGLVSENFATLSPLAKVLDYAHHMVLPTLCLTLGGLAIEQVKARADHAVPQFVKLLKEKSQ